MILARFNTIDRDFKFRMVEVIKQEVYDDVDRLTFKWMEANSQRQNARRNDPLTLVQQNAVSADTTEKLDGRVIARLVNFRDATLRRKIAHSLTHKADMYGNDVLALKDSRYFYPLKLDINFNDNLIDPIAEYFHRFLVWGALYDWYGSLGLGEQAAFYKEGLDEVEADIDNTLRTPSIAKRPMQPFGPAKMP